MTVAQAHAPGLFGSARALLSVVALAFETRLELLGAELEEEAARVVWILRYSFAALLFGALGIGFAGLALLIAAWDNYRLPVAMLLAATFLGVAALAAAAAQRITRAKPRFLDATLDTLEKDCSALARRI